MNRPIIPDVSHWCTAPDDPDGVNFAKMQSSGAVGVIIRAGSVNKKTGVCYSDFDLDVNIALTNEMHDFPRWFYWFMRPKWGGKKQAEKFLEYVDGADFVGLIGDFEVSELGAIDTASQWDQFMEVIRYNYPDRRHLIYTRGEFWNHYAKYTPWAKYYDLWISIYPTFPARYTHPWQNKKYKPYTWDNWTFWQWTERGNAKKYGATSKDIDLSYFNGTLEEFRDYAGLSKPTQQKPVIKVIKPAGVEIKIIEE